MKLVIWITNEPLYFRLATEVNVFPSVGHFRSEKNLIFP